MSLAKIQNIRAVDQAMVSYMTELLSMAQLPMDPADLSNIHTVAEKKAIEGFITMSFNDNDQIYQQELMVKLNSCCVLFCICIEAIRFSSLFIHLERNSMFNTNEAL